MNKVPAHPDAGLFPLLDAERFGELVEDIRENGQRVPIVVDGQDRVIDGRNRWLACQKLGIEPRTERIESTEAADILGFIISTNLKRRDLSSSQRAAVIVDIDERMEAYRQAAQESQRAGLRKGSPPVGKQIYQRGNGRTRERAAKAARTNPKYVSDAQRLKRDRPEIFEQVKAGDLAITEANRLIREQTRQAKLEAQAARAAEDSPAGTVIDSLEAVAGRWRALYIDPPWQYRDSGVSAEGEATALHGAAEHHYSTMPLDELERLPVGQLAHPEGCFLWLWTTWPMIRDGAPQRLLDAWGFEWKSELIWDKERPGTGRWLMVQTEVLILATSRGSTLSRQRRDVRGIMHEARREHSRKPEGARAIVETFGPGPRLELFARGCPPEGWSAWGKEARSLDTNKRRTD